MKFFISISNIFIKEQLYCHYDEWTSTPPESIKDFVKDPHWHLKIDRIRQFASVYYLTTEMLREEKPRSLAYVWHGAKGQGVDLFHHRLAVEFQEKLRDVFVYEVRPEWPMEPHNFHHSFEDMFTEVFHATSMSIPIPARIRTLPREPSGRQTLIYVRHQPLRSSKVITLDNLKKYLEWWDSHFAPLLEHDIFALLGISFVVGNPKKFHKTLIDKKTHR